MAYPRRCKYCGQRIVMSELDSGNWQPWEADGSGRHQCSSSRVPTTATLAWISSNYDPETYLTRCPWCREHVYYHTNGNGDCVYFDSLGYPWQIHACWEKYWKEAQARRRVLISLSNLPTLDHQKLHILAEVLIYASYSIVDDQVFYNIHETTIAQRLGISVSILQLDFGHLYRAEPKGIKLLNPKSQVKVNRPPKPLLSETLAELVNCEYCNKLIWQRALVDHLKTTHSLSTVTCTSCNEQVLKRSFKRHLEECSPRNKRKQKKRKKGSVRVKSDGSTNTTYRRRSIT